MTSIHETYLLGHIRFFMPRDIGLNFEHNNGTLTGSRQRCYHFPYNMCGHLDFRDGRHDWHLIEHGFHYIPHASKHGFRHQNVVHTWSWSTSWNMRVLRYHGGHFEKRRPFLSQAEFEMSLHLKTTTKAYSTSTPNFILASLASFIHSAYYTLVHHKIHRQKVKVSNCTKITITYGTQEISQRLKHGNLGRSSSSEYDINRQYTNRHHNALWAGKKLVI